MNNEESYKNNKMEIAEPTTNVDDQIKASNFRQFAMETTSNGDAENFVDTLASVDFDVYNPVATFKYVLIAAKGRSDRYLVRGVEGAAYHADSAEPTLLQLQKRNAQHDVLGGGRIKYDQKQKTIFIYGYSMGFPWRNGSLHHITQEVCEKAFPDYNISWSNEGY
eukprot:m.337652 g.337652  ORF g.337652 m.337652 type:complete len:165 (+) comp18194_c0_seq1:177-671(+)